MTAIYKKNLVILKNRATKKEFVLNDKKGELFGAYQVLQSILKCIPEAGYNQFGEKLDKSNF